MYAIPYIFPVNTITSSKLHCVVQIGEQMFFYIPTAMALQIREVNPGLYSFLDKFGNIW
jgi:hypothetical protein